MALTDKQRRFAAEYSVDFNATQAAIRAGYKATNADVTGPRLLGNVGIQELVRAKSAKVEAKLEVTKEFVLGELLTIAKLDLGDAYDASGNLKPVHEIPDHVRRAMAGLETDEIWAGKGEDRVLVGITKKVKFLDKIRALEALGRHLKLFTDKVIHSADDELLEALRESRKPVEA